ncbi:MAG TPA: ABC transporter substrate-binding protein [Allosphingosinicella sp.]|nr:ABC transporter substrate-binding protein [Allosphingosinicella sp.]
MAIRTALLGGMLAGALLVGGCEERHSGPVRISAIGGEPKLANPNLTPLDPPSAAMILATAQGLVRFDAAGQIEPALAQSWIVSDDGLRYTFRLRRTNWNGDGKVTAEQVVARLKAILSPASRNPLKPLLLGSIQEIVAMTDEVLEISLVAPRPNFLQLLAQPEMGIIHANSGAGPYHPVPSDGGVVSLHLPDEEEVADEAEAEAEADEDRHDTAVQLRGERTALAVARFVREGADLVLGGTAGDLPIARAAELPGGALQFDPVAGLFGLSFGSREGPLGEASVRRALDMAVDRAALVSALGVPDLQPRETLLPPGIAELPQPAAPGWTAEPLPMRRTRAAQAIAAATGGEPLNIRVAMPDGPGYRLVFAHLRRDWRAIGVDAERVPPGTPRADLRLIDAVAPVDLASWYLRQFSCAASAICDASADEIMAAARIAPTPQNRQALLASADRVLTDLTPFIALAAPVRWSLVSPRLTGFRPNRFGHHNISELIAQER